MLAASDVAAHEDRHLRGEAGEVERRLAGRVAAADHVGVLAARAPCASATDAP